MAEPLKMKLLVFSLILLCASFENLSFGLSLAETADVTAYRTRPKENTWLGFNKLVNEKKQNCSILIVTKDYCEVCAKFVRKFKEANLLKQGCLVDGTDAFNSIGGGYVVPQIYVDGRHIGAREADEIIREGTTAA